MPRITITGVGVDVDGTYDLDLTDMFDGHELHLIKQYAGVRAGEMGEAIEAGDSDLIYCLAKIAMDRAGRDVSMDRLLKTKFGQLQLAPTEAEKEAEEGDDEVPPVSAPSGANDGESEKSSSGPVSENGSEQNPASDQLGIGVRVLPTGSESSRETLAS